MFGRLQLHFDRMCAGRYHLIEIPRPQNPAGVPAINPHCHIGKIPQIGRAFYEQASASTCVFPRISSRCQREQQSTGCHYSHRYEFTGIRFHDRTGTVIPNLAARHCEVRFVGDGWLLVLLIRCSAFAFRTSYRTTCARFGTAHYVNLLKLTWRNWQTRTAQDRMGQPVEVRVLS